LGASAGGGQRLSLDVVEEEQPYDFFPNNLDGKNYLIWRFIFVKLVLSFLFFSFFVPITCFDDD
jgi:hypothetical protein